MRRGGISARDGCKNGRRRGKLYKMHRFSLCDMEKLVGFEGKRLRYGMGFGILNMLGGLLAAFFQEIPAFEGGMFLNRNCSIEYI